VRRAGWSEIDLVSAGEIILSKKVESYYQVKEETASNKLRLYFFGK
jgi:hypothetical protein